MIQVSHTRLSPWNVAVALVVVLAATAPGEEHESLDPVEQVNAADGGHQLTRRVSFESLLEELVDRDRLAVFPEGEYTQHQVSSHDPRNARNRQSRSRNR